MRYPLKSKNENILSMGILIDILYPILSFAYSRNLNNNWEFGSGGQTEKFYFLRNSTFQRNYLNLNDEFLKT